MIITNNLLADNANIMYKLNTTNKTKSAKKLSSGYRINSAADDAAGLTISEKMREQIRGLNKGTQNAQDGISWIQTGEGALNEVHAILHRMTELTVQSLNDTNTEEDRAALQEEFDALQSEVDRICGTTQFNTKNIFSSHEPDYYQCEGNKTWDQGTRQVVTQPDNTLEITYRMNDTDPAKTVSITVPEGVYTTQELIDEIDDAMQNTDGAKDGLNFEYTKDGTCNINIEVGKMIEGVSGGLSYLIYDMYNGGSIGALIGTTVFPSEYVKLDISAGNNDNMTFQIQDFDGNVKNMDITIKEGAYTRKELIDLLNDKLQGTGVEAVAYGTGIKLQSDEAIITGFKGNMFKIDTGDDIYTSVFYDNVMYGNVVRTPARFRGGSVLPTDTRDEKHNHFTIDSSNNTLKMSANGGNVQDIIIPESEYTAAQMAEKLNELFNNNGIKVSAALYTSGGYQGIELTSEEKGIESSIDIDKTSSAYMTLFTDCEYTSFVTDADVSYDNTDNKAPQITGGKTFGTREFPLVIEDGKNDSFKLKIGNDSYNVKLSAGSYSTIQGIINEINEQLNGTGAGIGYKCKINVSQTSGRLILTGAEGSGVSEIHIEEITGNNGYRDLFVGKDTKTSNVNLKDTGTSTTPAKITTNTTVGDTTNITDDNNKFNIKINGQNQEIILPKGNLTRKEILDSINAQLKEQITVSPNTFTEIDTRGTSADIKTSLGGNGTTSVNNKTYKNQGSSDYVQGEAGSYKNNVPATVTIDVKLPDNISINGDNNEFVIKLNGEERKLVLDSGTYTKNQLVNMLQNKIDESYGKYTGGAKVSLDNGRLVFTSRLNNVDNTESAGKYTSIELSSTGSSFMKELHTTRTAATGTSSRDIQSSVTVTDDNNEFVFSYTDKNGDSKDVSLTLTNGTYDRAGIVNEINKQLKNQNVSITASLSGNRLTLTTNDTGANCKISYSNTTGGKSADAIFGDSVAETPAKATAGCNVQNTVTIDDSTNEFNINVNGTQYNLTLENGTYTPDTLVNQLNEKLKNAGAGVTVSLSGGKLTYTTDKKGVTASIKMTYESGGTSMKQIYGETTTKKYGATASFTPDGKLEITANDNNGTLEMSSDKGGIFLKGNETTTDINPTETKGYISTKKAYIDGKNLTEPVTIDKWNKSLKFTYIKNGSSVPVSIELKEQTYTFDELKKELQDKLDAAAGTGQFNVSVGATGVRIECANPGKHYRMEKSTFSGGFYYNVLCSSTDKSSNKTPTSTVGGQQVNQAYTIGRRDVKNGTVEIESGLNDELTFDFKYGNDTKTFNMKLDSGRYNGNSLIKEIQKKLNEQLKASGLDENLIEVNIGGVSTGIVGANDDKALCFKLSRTVNAPADGEYIIDGVRGSAAFYVFYQSEGRMEAAYTKGAKDVTQGLEITDENNQLGFDVDSVSYTLTLDNGEYTSEEIINQINDKLTQGNVPLKAKLDGKNIKLVYNKFGKHTIDNVTGSARKVLFYQENEGDGKSQDIKLQLSGNAGDMAAGTDSKNAALGRDYFSVERRVVNTVSLGINSITISRPKYAEKALKRLRNATDKVSAIRTEFGAEQNRLEHAIKANENTSENTQRAESGIRDTDMAREMVEYSKHSILQNAAQSMISQANSIPEEILELLQ